MLGLFDVEVKEYGSKVIISNFQTRYYLYRLRVEYGSSRVPTHIFSAKGHYRLSIENFFLPDLYWINQRIIDSKQGMYNLGKLGSLQEKLLQDTWLRKTQQPIENEADLKRLNEIAFTLRDYQHEFVEQYSIKKQRMALNGYLLAADVGTGKTAMSISLAKCLNLDTVIVVCPKSLIRSVWQKEIFKVDKNPGGVFCMGDTPSKQRYYVFNYESLDKAIQMASLYTGRVGIFIDESHHLKDIKAKSTQNLIKLINVVQPSDVVPMSGTPVKALGSECMPIMKMIDPMFNEDVQIRFKKIFRLSGARDRVTEILSNRLGMVMHRIQAHEVLTLPDKTVKDLKIKIPNGKKYTTSEVLKQVSKFGDERKAYYEKNMDKYVRDYEECLHAFETTLMSHEKEEYKQYTVYVKLVRKGYNRAKHAEVVKWINKYEKEVIIPRLSSIDKKRFKAAKSVVKYVSLKIMGEIIGGLLNRLRADLYSELIEHSGLDTITREAIKKTICFTMYLDTAKTAEAYFKKKKFKPLLVTGETIQKAKDASNIIEEFKANDELNPLIATIQTISTGVTVIEANTVIFLSGIWRDTDFIQASNRVYRIGQDTEVFIYKLILDTGAEDNLSTRMEDILSWSKDMFMTIMGDDVDPNVVNKFFRDAIDNHDVSSIINKVTAVADYIKQKFGF